MGALKHVLFLLCAVTTSAILGTLAAQTVQNGGDITLPAKLRYDQVFISELSSVNSSLFSTITLISTSSSNRSPPPIQLQQSNNASFSEKLPLKNPKLSVAGSVVPSDNAIAVIPSLMALFTAAVIIFC